MLESCSRVHLSLSATQFPYHFHFTRGPLSARRGSRSVSRICPQLLLQLDCFGRCLRSLVGMVSPCFCPHPDQHRVGVGSVPSPVSVASSNSRKHCIGVHKTSVLCLECLLQHAQSACDNTPRADPPSSPSQRSRTHQTRWMPRRHPRPHLPHPAHPTPFPRPPPPHFVKHLLRAREATSAALL